MKRWAVVSRGPGATWGWRRSFWFWFRAFGFAHRMNTEDERERGRTYVVVDRREESE